MLPRSKILGNHRKAVNVVLAVIIIVILVIVAAVGIYYFTMSKSPTSSEIDVTVGTAVGVSEVYYLPMIIAQEKGFWAANGLNVTWQKFLGAPPMYQAFAASQLNVGLTAAGSTFDSVSRGIGVKLIGVYLNVTEFGIIVNANSSFHTVNELNGSTFAVTATNGLEAVYAQIIANKYHLVFHYVQTGSLPNSLALLEKGQAQAMDFTVGSVASLLQAGKLRVIYNDSEALPSPWAEFGVTATNNFIQNDASTLKKINLALSETIQFILNNPSFAEGVIENFTQSNPQVAAYVYGVLQSSWNPSLSMNPQALSNVDNVYVQYGITPSASAANVSSIYTTQFLPS
ncbi:MAG: ABC transporter substrate-binding protein [Nitrososphaerota archaeon]|nr:ABC transporter substrate-binding protein [Nitrososphaerota archaeon]